MNNINRLRIDSTLKRAGFASLEIKLKENDKAAGGHRSELKLFTHAYNKPESEVYYRFVSNPSGQGFWTYQLFFRAEYKTLIPEWHG